MSNDDIILVESSDEEILEQKPARSLQKPKLFGSTNDGNKDSNRLADNFAATTLQPNTVITVSPIVSPSSRDAETCQAANQRSSTFSYYNNPLKLYGANNQRVISNPEPTSPVFPFGKPVQRTASDAQVISSSEEEDDTIWNSSQMPTYPELQVNRLSSDEADEPNFNLSDREETSSSFDLPDDIECKPDVTAYERARIEDREPESIIRFHDAMADDDQEQIRFNVPYSATNQTTSGAALVSDTRKDQMPMCIVKLQNIFKQVTSKPSLNQNAVGCQCSVAPSKQSNADISSDDEKLRCCEVQLCRLSDKIAISKDSKGQQNEEAWVSDSDMFGEDGVIEETQFVDPGNDGVGYNCKPEPSDVEQSKFDYSMQEDCIVIDDDDDEIFANLTQIVHPMNEIMAEDEDQGFDSQEINEDWLPEPDLDMEIDVSDFIDKDDLVKQEQVDFNLSGRDDLDESTSNVEEKLDDPWNDGFDYSIVPEDIKIEKADEEEREKTEWDDDGIVYSTIDLEQLQVEQKGENVDVAEFDRTLQFKMEKPILSFVENNDNRVESVVNVIKFIKTEKEEEEPISFNVDTVGRNVVAPTKGLIKEEKQIVTFSENNDDIVDSKTVFNKRLIKEENQISTFSANDNDIAESAVAHSKVKLESFVENNEKVDEGDADELNSETNKILSVHSGDTNDFNKGLVKKEKQVLTFTENNDDILKSVADFNKGLIKKEKQILTFSKNLDEIADSVAVCNKELIKEEKQVSTFSENDDEIVESVVACSKVKLESFVETNEGVADKSNSETYKIPRVQLGDSDEDEPLVDVMKRKFLVPPNILQQLRVNMREAKQEKDKNEEDELPSLQSLFGQNVSAATNHAIGQQIRHPAVGDKQKSLTTNDNSRSNAWIEKKVEQSRPRHRETSDNSLSEAEISENCISDAEISENKLHSKETPPRFLGYHCAKKMKFETASVVREFHSFEDDDDDDEIPDESHKRTVKEMDTTAKKDEWLSKSSHRKVRLCDAKDVKSSRKRPREKSYDGSNNDGDQVKKTAEIEMNISNLRKSDTIMKKKSRTRRHSENDNRRYKSASEACTLDQISRARQQMMNRTEARKSVENRILDQVAPKQRKMSNLLREDKAEMQPNLPSVSKTSASASSTATLSATASSISIASGRRMSENTNKTLQQKSDNKKHESTGTSKSKVDLEKKKNESGHHSKSSATTSASSKKNPVATNNVSSSHDKNFKHSSVENRSSLPEISSKVGSVTDRQTDSREMGDVSSKHKISSKSHGGSFVDFFKSSSVVHKEKPGIEMAASGDSNSVAEIDNLAVRKESRMDEMVTRNDTPVGSDRILTDRTFSNEKTASTKFIENKNSVSKDPIPSSNSEKSSFMKSVESKRFVIKKLPPSLISNDVLEYRSPIAENIPENHHHHHQNAEKKNYTSDDKSSTRHAGKHGDDSARRGSKEKSKHRDKVHRSESHPGKSKDKNENERHFERQSSTKSVNKEEKDDAVRKDSKSHDHRSKNDDQENKSKRKNEQENQKSNDKMDGKQIVSEIGKESSKTGHKSTHKEHSRSVHHKSNKSGSKDNMAKSSERQHSSKSSKTVYPDGRRDSSRTCVDGTRKIPLNSTRIEDIRSNNSADKLNENVKLPLQIKQTVDQLNFREDRDDMEKKNIRSGHVASIATSHNTRDDTSSPSVIEVSKTVTGEVTADDIRFNLNYNNSCQSESIAVRDVAVIRPVVGETTSNSMIKLPNWSSIGMTNLNTAESGECGLQDASNNNLLADNAAETISEVNPELRPIEEKEQAFPAALIRNKDPRINSVLYRKSCDVEFTKTNSRESLVGSSVVNSDAKLEMKENKLRSCSSSTTSVSHLGMVSLNSVIDESIKKSTHLKPLILSNSKIASEKPVTEVRPFKNTKNKVMPNWDKPVARIDPSSTITEDKFKYQMLNWNAKWLTECHEFALKKQMKKGPPPIVDMSKVFPLLETYASYEDYVNIVYPLLLLDTWESIYSEWSENRGRRPPFQGIAHSVDLSKKSEKKMLLQCQGTLHDYDFRNGNVFREKDLVVVNLIQPQEKSTNGNVLAYPKAGSARIEKPVFGLVVKSIRNDRKYIHPQVEEMLKKDAKLTLVSLTIHLVFRQIPIDETVFMKIEYASSMVSTFRQIHALENFPKNQLAREILRPHELNVFFHENSLKYGCELEELKRAYSNTQWDAISRISAAVLEPYAVKKICLLQGPPGTGKSHTVIGLIEQIVSQLRKKNNNRSSKILICAPSNAGIDEICRRLIARNKRLKGNDQLNFVRVGSASASPEVRANFLDEMARVEFFRAEEAKNTSISAAKDALDKKIELIQKKMAKCDQDRQSNEINSLNSELIRLQKQKLQFKLKMNPRQEYDAKCRVLEKIDIICSTLSGSSMTSLIDVWKKNKMNNFACVIVDEACQCTELDTLIPLQYQTTKLVLVGDPHQLPPTVLSTIAAEKNYGQSLFERLYGQFYLLDDNPVVMLQTQYRMHPEICSFSSTHVYRGKLETDQVIAKKRQNFPFHPYSVFDLKYTHEELDNSGGSYVNKEESDFVIALCKYLLSNVPPLQRDQLLNNIGIIAPYASQKRQISTMLARSGISTIEVGTVDGFQGREKDVIILSCVRANREGNIGFFHDRRRLNVSLTRARYALYIVGNMHTFQANVDWKALLSDASRRKRVISVVNANEVNQKIKIGCMKAS